MILGVALGVAACGSASRTKVSVATPTPRPNTTTSRRPLAGGRRVLLKGLRDPQAYAPDGWLYVADDVTPPSDPSRVNRLMRIDPRSGRVLATRRLGSAYGAALLTDGALWVITYSFPGQERASYRILRLDPRSLTVRSRTNLPAARERDSTGSLAVAAHHLWVGAGALYRLSLTTGQVDRVVKLPYRGPIQIASGRRGQVLLASLGLEHPTYIARLNPRTGTLQRRTTVSWSVLQPLIEGTTANGAWVSDSTGMTTTSWRIDLRTLRRRPDHVPAFPGSRVLAVPLDGVLWVTRPDGGNEVTYCADDVTGKPRAWLRVLRNATLLTAHGTSVYYSRALRNGSIALSRAPISSTCLPSSATRRRS